MARFITVTVACDWGDCDVHAAEDDGRVISRTLSIDGKQAREFLLCKPHLDVLDEILLPLMQKGVKAEVPTNGRSRKPAGSGSGPRSTPAPVPGTTEGDSLVCKVEDCDRHGRPLHNRTGMAQHVIRAHGYADLATYENDFGPVVNMPKEPTPT